MRMALSLSVVVGAAMAYAAGAAPVTVYVGPEGVGTEAGDGSRARPLASLDAALEKTAAEGGADGGTIVLLPGLHVRPTTWTIGAKTRNLTITSDGAQRATIAGGQAIPVSAFHPVSDAAVLDRADPAARGKLLELDLKGLNLQHIGPYPEFFVGNGGLIDLFVDGQRMPLSRWPNGGDYVAMAKVTDSGLKPKPHGGTFEYRGDRPARWKAAAEKGSLWVVGYWRVPWICQSVQVASIDADKRQITLAAVVPQGIGSKYTPEVNGTRPGDGKEPWYVTNLLEEIDQPGEWCVDFTTQRLYLLPPSGTDLSKARIIISDTVKPVVEVAGATGIRLQNIDVYGGLGDALAVTDARDCQVAGVRVLAAGTNGIMVKGGENVAVQSCDVSNTGGVGINVNGGDRKTLTARGHTITNNHVTLTGRNDRSTYGVSIDGVGVKVTHNLVHDVPLGGIFYTGNDHVMELNELHNLGLEGGDLGAFYANGDWAGRNNLVRHNLVHHGANTNGTYFDDGRSGDRSESNIFYKVRCGPFIGGGHGNTAIGNVVIDSNIGLHLDDRGIARGYTRDSKGALTRFLNTLDLKAEPWSTRYPELLAMLAEPDRLPIPTKNIVTGNLLIGCRETTTFTNDKAQITRDNTLSPNTVVPLAASPFPHADKLDFSTVSNAAMLEAVPGWSAIPVKEIGLKVDEFRTALPTDEETGRLESRKTRTIFDSQQDVNRSNELGREKKK